MYTQECARRVISLFRFKFVNDSSYISSPEVSPFAEFEGRNCITRAVCSETARASYLSGIVIGVCTG